MQSRYWQISLLDFVDFVDFCVYIHRSVGSRIQPDLSLMMALNEMGEDWDSRDLMGLDPETSNGSEFQNYVQCTAPVADNYVRRLLWEMCSPAILAVGVVGNILVLVVMTRRRMRGTSTSVYLVAMAILDLIVLTVGLVPHWLAGAKYIVLKDLHPVSCKVEKFLDYSSGDAAVWVRVAFTIDRFVAVLFPLYTGRCCGRPRAARGYTIAATVAAVLKNFHIFWTCGAEHYTCIDSNNGSLVTTIENCIYPEPYRNFEMYVRPWITFTLVSVAPFIIIAVCNTFIIVALVMRRRNMKTVRRTVSNGGKKGQQFVQMAAMCVAASMMFLVCNLPTIVILIGRPRWTKGQQSSIAHAIVKAAFNLLFYVTFSANFFIYCMTGGRFRSTLRHCCGGSSTRRYSVNESCSEPSSRNGFASPRRQTSAGLSAGGGSSDELSTSPTWLPAEWKDPGTENGIGGATRVTSRRLLLKSREAENADKINGVKDGQRNGRITDKLNGNGNSFKRTDWKNEKEICEFILTVV